MKWFKLRDIINVLEKFIAFWLYDYSFSSLLAFNIYKWQIDRLRKGAIIEISEHRFSLAIEEVLEVIGNSFCRVLILEMSTINSLEVKC